MCFVKGRSHHHDEYRSVNTKLYVVTFIPAFAGWKALADKSGVEILNATPNSALKEFPMVEIERILQ